MNGRMDFSEEGVRQGFVFGGLLILEEVFPDLAGSHVEPKTYCFESSWGRSLAWFWGDGDEFLVDAFGEAGDEWRVKGSDFGFIGIEGVSCRVLTEPYLHEGHKDAATVEVGMIEGRGLLLPFVAELASDPLNESWELIKLLFCRIAVEEVKLGVVVDFSFLWPQVAFWRFCTKSMSYIESDTVLAPSWVFK